MVNAHETVALTGLDNRDSPDESFQACPTRKAVTHSVHILDYFGSGLLCSIIPAK